MNDFSRQDIETLKASVDLCELIRTHGIELKPVGRNLTALCPWHDDKDASLVVNPEKQLYNCFGCEAKGDALSFLQVQEQLSFPQAVMRLREIAGDTSQASPSDPVRPDDPDRFPGGHTRNDLLEKVCRHYQKGLEGSEEARQYLKDRKLWNSELYEGFQFGYCDGTLLKALPKGDVRDALGLRDRAILELFYSSALRNAELRLLQVGDVDFSRLQVRVYRGKGGRGRVVPVGEVAAAWVERYLAEARAQLLQSKEHGFLFISFRGRPFKCNRLGEVVARNAEEAGLPMRVTPHVLRHCCATHMLRNNVRLRHLQEFLGHASPSSTQIYTRVEISELKQAHKSCHPREHLR